VNNKYTQQDNYLVIFNFILGMQILKNLFSSGIKVFFTFIVFISYLSVATSKTGDPTIKEGLL
jgi:hypothetical protein